MATTRKLIIKYNQWEHLYELWEEYYNTEEKLYPLSCSFSIELSRNIKILIDFAKRKFPDIYHESTIIDSTIIKRNLPAILDSGH